MPADKPLRVALVAGEASGDQLGAGLISALRSKLGDDVTFSGVAGPAMRDAGCDVWFDSDALAVMGLMEVVAHLPRLLLLRRRLYKRLIADPPDVFIGIDAPDFNLGLEKRLHRAGIATMHYVSPSVWAWRPGRAAAMAESADTILCLLPFEPAFYQDYGVAAEFVGHPLADHIALRPDTLSARVALGLPENGPIVALLPGSRAGELKRFGADFAAAAKLLAQQRPGICFVAPMASPLIEEKFAAQIAIHAPNVDIRLVDRQAQQAIAAADVILVASGTATLEALLLKKPMVVAYRLAKTTHALLEKFKLLNIDKYSLPNLLAGKQIVPEIIQNELTPERLASELLTLLDAPDNDQYLLECDAIHTTLRRNANVRAAEAVLRLCGKSNAI